MIQKGELETQTPPRKEHKGTCGKLRTADTTVINQIMWPAGQPAVLEDVRSMAFINDLSVMALLPENIKSRMLTHLHKMLEDWEA